MKNKILYSPSSINKEFKKIFNAHNWYKHRVHCDYTDQYYSQEYTAKSLPTRAYREMDF